MLEGAKLIGAGAATIALAGAAAGIGNALSSLIHSVARNPSLAKQLSGYAYHLGLGVGLNQSYCLFELLDRVSYYSPRMRKQARPTGEDLRAPP